MTDVAIIEKPDHLYEYLAKVVSIHDGDSIRVDIDLGFRTWIHDEPVRLYGIDTPEITGAERAAGLEAKAFLESKLNGQEFVLLRTFKDARGKYGRWLADVLVWEEATKVWHSVNQMLLDSGHALPYED